MKLNRSILVFLIFISLLSEIRAQNNFQKGYFLFPFKPGRTNYLSGSMGELRANHFHGGIDIKTEARVGLPILAAADGYISRVKVSTLAYGNVIYITHPNNLVTLYAHLDKFSDSIANYVRSNQYRKESFEIELFPPKHLLQVKKGQIIGLSGNTGGSRGPHLHFEVRDANENMMNPLLFNFPEIKDNIAPVIDKIALATFSTDARVNDKFGRMEFKASKPKEAKNFSIPSTIKVWGDVGIQLKTFDRMNGTRNSYGISKFQVKMDGQEIFSHTINVFPYSEIRSINAHLDYDVLMRKGVRFEKCYVSDGNRLPTYKKTTANGRLNIQDTLTHKMEIVVYDALNNSSILNFKIKGEKPKAKPKPSPNSTIGPMSFEIHENILKMEGWSPGSAPAKLFIKNTIFNLPPAYIDNGEAVFLYDLRKGLPDSAVINGKVLNFNFATTIPSARAHYLKHFDLNMEFPLNALFDTLYLQYENGIMAGRKETFKIADITVPLFDSVKITLKPSVNIPDKKGLLVYWVSKSGGTKCEGGTWEDNTITFKTKTLGKFAVLKDSIPPVIKLIQHKGSGPLVKNRISFNIFDKNSGIDSFRATLNGKWILMNYDHKRKLLWSELLNDSIKMTGEFILLVKDKAGNSNTFKINLP